MNIPELLAINIPGAQYMLKGDAYEGLEWHPANEFDKPTEDDFTLWETEYNNSANDRLVIENAKNAPLIRDEIINGVIIVGGQAWQVNAKSRENIITTIDYATRNDMLDHTTTWILADNTKRIGTTIDDLNAVLNAYSARMKIVFDQYILWAEGDMLEQFEVTE